MNGDQVFRGRGGRVQSAFSVESEKVRNLSPGRRQASLLPDVAVDLGGGMQEDPVETRRNARRMMRARKAFVALLFLAGCISTASANKVTELYLHPPSDLSVKVESKNGVAYDEVVSTGSLSLTVDADCRFDRKAGFQEYDLNELWFIASGLKTKLSSPFLQSSKLGYWVETPLDNIRITLKTTYEGPSSGFADPVQVCNDELARRMFKAPGTPREEFMAKGFSVTVPGGGRAKVTLVCNPVLKGGFTDYKDSTKPYDLKIECLPSKAAKEKLVDGDSVDVIGFDVVRDKAAMTCPGKVKFRGRIKSDARVSGKAWLEYLPIGSGGPKAGTSKKVSWSMNKPGKATSTFEQPWDFGSEKWIKGKTRLVVSWKDLKGKTWTAKSTPVTFERKCSGSGGFALAPQINSDTVQIRSFRVDKGRETIKCPGEVTFKATITSKEKLSGQVWLETVPKTGRPRLVEGGRKLPWSMNKGGKATSTLVQKWNPKKKGEWIDSRTRLVVSWKDTKGRTYTTRSRPTAFSRQCTKTVGPVRLKR